MQDDADVIGIDLGTTNCCVAVWDKDHAEVILLEGASTMPSFVAFREDRFLVGEPARNQATTNVSNTVFDAKRFIGRKFTDTSVQMDKPLWPFKLVPVGEKPMVQVDYKGDTKLYAAEQISSMVLMRLKDCAQAHFDARLGEGKVVVRRAVITVPAYFNDAQRQGTRDAAHIAGLSVERMINEPTAAAMDYGLKHGPQGDSADVRNVLIFDLGGGTFDVSLLSITDSVIQVKATSGDAHLGGQDFNAVLVDHFTDVFQRLSGKDIRGNTRALLRLQTACERAKCKLSNATVVDVVVDCLCDGVDLNSTLSRVKFEELLDPLLSKCIPPVRKCLDDAGMVKADVWAIVLVGGSTAIPRVHKLLREFFDGKELCVLLNPDQAVARGAAVQAAILSRMLPGRLLMDVTPLSLGIMVEGGIMQTVVPRNERVPAWKELCFSTTVNNQTKVLFQVFEGERVMVRDNNLLGQFTLEGIDKAPRGVPQLTLTMHIDADGCLDINAVDASTGSSKGLTITHNPARLDEKAIAAMVAEALQLQADDVAVRRKVEATNELERYIFHMGQSSQLEGLSVDDLAVVRDTLRAAKLWLEDPTVLHTSQAIMHKLDEVELACSNVFTAMHDVDDEEDEEEWEDA